MDEYDPDEPNLEEQEFHNNVREQIIFLLLFILLYLISYLLLQKFRRRGSEDFDLTDEDEVTVYRISTWLCSFILAVSIGAVLLLPISIISNEVLIAYPNSYYIKWLNGSLIHGLWNYIFLFSNLSLFVFLPFVYLFAESEGFLGSPKGLKGRLQETCTVMALLAVMVFGFTYIISATIDSDKSSFQTLWNLRSYYLPFLYSCMSFLGVLFLLVCTPLGFVKLFDVASQILIKPNFLRNINEEYHVCAVEEECLRRRLRHAQSTGKSYVSPPPIAVDFTGHVQDDENCEPPQNLLRLRNGELRSGLEALLEQLEAKRKLLEQQRRAPFFRRNVLFPLGMLLITGLTVSSVLLVVANTISLLVGIKALPLSSKQFTLGVSSLSKLGPFGAAVEIILILYLIAASTIGLYTTPIMSRMRPKLKQTPFDLVIANCAVILVLSSALPLLSKILGITNFDLMGDYGSIEWLGNFKIVLFYNVVFATTSTLCVVNKFTARVRREVYSRLVENYVLLSNLLTNLFAFLI